MDCIKHVADWSGSPESHRLYKAADGSGLTLGHIADPTVDEARMIASAVISTPTPDRDDDIVEPQGVVLAEYELNPVVLWEHGFRSVDTAIAKSVVDGKFSVHVFPDRIEADCQFSHRNKTSEQIFALIADGIVRATSVRVSPIEAVTRPGREPDRMGLHITKWSMAEWSWCMIGANPEAVAKTLRSGKIEGRKIEPRLAKSLTAALPKSTSTTVAGSPMPTKSKPKSDLPKADPPEDEVPADESAEPKADEPAEEPADEASNSGDQPYGAQVLAGLHASIGELAGFVESALGPMEQPEVKEYLTQCVDDLQAKLAEVEGMYGSKYPDAAPLAAPADPESEGLKTWLKSAAGNRLQLAGYGNRLKALLRAKNLQPMQQKILADTLKGLSRIEAESRTITKTNDQQALDDLQAKLTKLQERLAQRA